VEFGAYAYLCGGHGPDLEVVWAHEHVGDTLTLHSQNPLIEVLGLRIGDTTLHGGINETINSLDLVLFGQDGDVVLEGVGDPEVLVTNVRDSLMGVPVIVFGKSLVETVVKVLVVGEDDVTTDIV
jgi:hypothetical protein